MDATSTIEELVQELNQPDLNGWKLFAQTSGLSVYRRPDDKLMRYKCYQTIPDVSPEIYFQVGLDIHYRLVWDKYLKEAKEIKDGEKEGVYWQIIMPLLIDNRDYTFVRESSEHDINGTHYYYSMTRCEPFANEPVRKKVVRVDVCRTQTLLCSDGGNGLKSLFIYYEEPRGNIPRALWAWAAKFGVPYYAKVTLNACKAYPAWLKDKKTTLPAVTDVEPDNGTASASSAFMESTDELTESNKEAAEENVPAGST